MEDAEADNLIEEHNNYESRRAPTNWKEFLRERLKGKPVKEFGISVAFFYSAVFVMTFFMNFVHWRTPDPKANPPLPDLLHEWFSQPDLHGLSEPLFYMNTILTITSGLYYYRFNFFPYGIRFMVAWGCTWYLRSIALLVTSLPTTSAPECREGYHRDGITNMYWNTFIGVFSFGNANVHCGDLLFSGHSVLITLDWLFVLSYLSHNMPIVMASSLLSFSKMFFIIIERKHYTIDVLVSFYITLTIWKFTPEALPMFLASPVAWLKSLANWKPPPFPAQSPTRPSTSQIV